MGFGSEEKRRQKFFLSIKTQRQEGAKKWTDAHFVVEKQLYPAVDGKKTEHLPDETQVSGQLIGIGHGEYVYEGKSVKKVWLTLVDGDREFKVEAGVNSGLGRNLINRVINLKSLGWLMIRLYTKADKEGKDQANLYMEINGEKADWKYNYTEDLKPLVKMVPDPQDPSKNIAVYHAVNDKLLNDWIAIEPRIKSAAVKAMADQGVTTDEVDEGSASIESDDFPASDITPPPPTAADEKGSDDLPF